MMLLCKDIYDGICMEKFQKQKLAVEVILWNGVGMKNVQKGRFFT